MEPKTTLLGLLLCAGFTKTYATEPEAMLPQVSEGTTAVALGGFEENKGQVRTTTGEPAQFVRYRLLDRGTSIFLLENGIAYQFNRFQYPAGYETLYRHAHYEESEQLDFEMMRQEARLETYRMDVTLEGANPRPHITTEGRSIDYTNYYNCGVLDVHSYVKVTYHDVYPDIDWVVYTTPDGMKYDFIVKPGADPNHIALRFTYHEELYVDEKGRLVHGNRLGRFTEAKPISFQGNELINTQYKLLGSKLMFQLANYDSSKALIIDPSRVWGTYYGGSSNEISADCTSDTNGNVYLIGTTSSTGAIAALGHQIVLGGALDAFLAKFSPTGVRQWSTYYGGPGNDNGLKCSVSLNGNVALAGFTVSTTAVSANGHQGSIGGGVDAFLAVFNPNGFRLWATYYGGSGNDRGNSCAFDAAGSIYLAGETTSDNNIAFNGHQNSYNGPSDAFLVKFDSNGLRQWGTYYGSLGDSERGYACSVAGTEHVCLAGSTNSYQSISFNGHQNISAGGVADAFLVKFNGSGIRQWATYYGTCGDDTGWSCAADSEGNTYLAGYAVACGDIANGGHQTTYGGGTSDAFLVKFNPSGQRVWGTFYGGSDEDIGRNCVVDFAGNVYLGGQTFSPNNIAANGFQAIYSGNGDAFIAKFNSNGQRIWGSYYGGSGNDGGSSCAFDQSGGVFISGITQSASAIAQNGHQNTSGGGPDAFLVKFDGGEYVGLIETAQYNELNCWPNPTEGIFHIETPNSAMVVSVAAWDATGCLVHVQKMAGMQRNVVLDLSTCRGGLYTIRVDFTDGTQSVTRVMKD